MSNLRIRIPRQPAYSVHITKKPFDLSLLPSRLRTRLRNESRSFFLLCPENLQELVARSFLQSSSGRELFPDGAQNPRVIWIRDGEKAKNIREIPWIYQRLIDAGVRRDSCIFILGGGVSGDLGGFIASTILRGVSFCFFPTTLLAAVDSCLGGKLAVNAESGKNMIGTFAQPAFVHIDVNFFATLPDLEWQCGLAEMIKHALLLKGKPNILNQLEATPLPMLQKDSTTLIAAIHESLKVKYMIVKKDPWESKGLRSFLNLGHTTAHALESINRYKCKHGIAVLHGLLTMLLLSRKRGLDNESIQRVIQIMKKSKLTLYQIPQSGSEIYGHALADKKNKSAKRANFILLHGLGDAVADQEIEEQEFCEAWEEHLVIAKNFELLSI